MPQRFLTQKNVIIKRDLAVTLSLWMPQRFLTQKNSNYVGDSCKSNLGFWVEGHLLQASTIQNPITTRFGEYSLKTGEYSPAPVVIG